MKKAYELLDSPEKWTRNYYARDSTNHPCDPDVKEAVCWCVIGICHRVYGGGNLGVVLGRLQAAVSKRANGRTRLNVYNDDPKTTFDDVRSLLKEVEDELPVSKTEVE